jgi:putative ABC transport system permease protein
VQWSALLGIGLRGLLLRKTRSLLSALGVVFGVAAVIAMSAIGEGARREAVAQIELLGTNNLRVKQLVLAGDRLAEAARLAPRGLTLDEAHLIRQNVPGVVAVAPLRFVPAPLRLGGREGLTEVIGTSPDYPEVTGFHVREGRFITALDLTDHKNVCVLGADVKRMLFQSGDAVGAPVRIGETWFTVVGVMESKLVREGRAAPMKVRNLNRDVYVPISTALRRFGQPGDRRVEEISIKVARPEDLSPVASLVRQTLQTTHRGATDYEVVIPEELLRQAQQTQRMFNVIMGSIAGISLLVGGIGIMNIMLANVSERRREIGIRRAIGATKAAILGQFLIETVLVCLAGGVIGIVLGFAMARIVTFYAGWDTAFSVGGILVAFGTATAVGVIFGLFPARRAAELNPVQALRFE